MPEGCTPIKGIDHFNQGQWEYMESRNQITCREKVPEAVWPHPDVPKPRWPALKRVPHHFDLEKATGEQGDKITQGYYRHLCDTEAGDWFFKKVSTDEPPSLFNMRPRFFFSEIRHSERSYDDRYWMQAPALAGANPTNAFVFDYDYKGDRLYGPKKHNFTSAQEEGKYFERNYYNPERKIYYSRLRTDPPTTNLTWVEKHPRGISMLERPVGPRGQEPYYPYLWPFATPEEARRRLSHDRDAPLRFPYYRFSYGPIELAKAKLEMGPEVLVAVGKPVPECDGDAWKSTPSVAPPNWPTEETRNTRRTCYESFGSQRLRITGEHESKARFGMVWREFFVSEHDLRLSIRGTDLMVVDMRTGEVIAHSRAFTKTVPTERHIPIFRGPLVKNNVYTCVGEASMSIIYEAINGVTRLSNKTGKPIPYSPPPVPGDPLVTRN